MKILIKYCCRLMVFFALITCFGFKLYAKTYDLTNDQIDVCDRNGKKMVYSYSGRKWEEDNNPIVTAEDKKGHNRINVFIEGEEQHNNIDITLKDLRYKSIGATCFLNVTADTSIYLDGSNKLEQLSAKTLFYVGKTVVIKPVDGSVAKLELIQSDNEYNAVKIEDGGKLKIEGSTQLSIRGNVENKKALDTTELTEDGFVQYLDADGKVNSIVRGTVIVDEHPWDDGVITRQPSCTTKGIKTYTCTAVPEHTKTEEIECLGHTYADASDPENWKKDSTGHWQECVRATCSPIFGGVTEKRNHTYADDESPICTVCGYDRTHKHTLTYVEAAEPTCTEAGNKAYYKCTECDTMYKDAFGIVCIEAKDAYLQPNGHKLEKHASVSATCTQDGNTEYYVCETCGNLYKDADGLMQIEDMHETIIPATGHAAGDSYQRDKNNHWKICSTCGKTLDKSSHSFNGRSCTVCGYRKPASSGGGAGSTGTMKAVTSSGTQGSWIHDEKGWWFRKTDGTYPKSGWTKLTWQGNSYWYYFNADGYMDMGWLDWNSKRYYLNPMIGTNSGRMFTGWQQIDGKWYYFSTEQDANEGSLLRGTTTPDGYRVCILSRSFP